MVRSHSTPDLWIILLTSVLLFVGFMMVYSASAVVAFREFGDSFYYVKRQLLFAVLGVFMMIVVMSLDYQIWRKYANIGLLCAFALLVLVLIPGIGVVRGGARSWLGIGSFGVQPSEFMKIAMILYLANRLSKYQAYIQHWLKGLMYPLSVLGIAFVLIMLQPDLGTGAVLVGTSVFMLYIAGVKLKHLSILGLLGAIGFVMLIVIAPYRLKRITAFIDPWSDPLGAGYQAIQSLFAVGPGGLVGLGYAQSRQKYSYLPEPQTDFIFAIISEELGFIGAGSVLLLFALFIFRGLKVAITAREAFGSFIAVGITGMIAVQVMINIGVVIGLFPVTGITLPFISAGGSSLTLMLTSVGLLLNISRSSR